MENQSECEIENSQGIFMIMDEKAIESLENENEDSTNNEPNCIIGIKVLINNLNYQIKYFYPNEFNSNINCDLLIIDEAAAIPSNLLENLILNNKNSNNFVWLSSTTDGYEGTAGALSLKIMTKLKSITVPYDNDNGAIKKYKKLLFSKCQ